MDVIAREWEVSRVSSVSAFDSVCSFTRALGAERGMEEERTQVSEKSSALALQLRGDRPRSSCRGDLCDCVVMRTGPTCRLAQLLKAPRCPEQWSHFEDFCQTFSLPGCAFIELIVRRARRPGCLGSPSVHWSFRWFFANWGTGCHPAHNWDGVWQPSHHLHLRTEEHFLLGPSLALSSFSENILPSLNPRTHVARFLSGCLNAQLPRCVLATCKLRGLWTALIPLKIRDKPLNLEGTISGYPADHEIVLAQEFVYKPFNN